MAQVKIKTKGMHCRSCAMLIVDALEDLDGVSKAEAYFKSGMVSVDFDSEKLTEKNIKDTILLEGYNVL